MNLVLASTASGSIGDPTSSRTVYAIVVGLLAIGVVLIALGVWVIRQTRVDPELLGPLERMADRRWRRLDPVGRRRLLDEVRPPGAEPVHRMPTPPEVDREFARPTPPVPSFDDLFEELIGPLPEVRPAGEHDADDDRAPDGEDGATAGREPVASDDDR